MSIREKAEKNRGVTIAICLFLLWGLEKIEHNRDVQRNIDRIETLQTQNERYEVSVDSLGAQTARQEVLLLDAKRDYQTLSEKFTELQNTKSQTKVITRTQIDSVLIPVQTIDTMFVDGNFAPIYNFRDSSEWYSIAGRVSPELALLEKVSFSNDITFSHRWERKNFLAKKTYFVEVKNTNPYVRIQGVQNYQIEEEKRFWETRRFGFIVGFGSGLYIARHISK